MCVNLKFCSGFAHILGHHLSQKTDFLGPWLQSYDFFRVPGTPKNPYGRPLGSKKLKTPEI